MLHDNVGTGTDPSKLRAVSNWRDHEAWVEFQTRYDPHLRRCCARLGLFGAAADDVCQETWIEVAKRMRSFVYDPRGTFRGWLWKVCHHEAIDFLERKKDEHTFPLEARDECSRHARNSIQIDEPIDELPLADVDEDHSALAGLFREAEEIQTAVKRRVEPHTWEAFWLVGVALWTVAETARYLEMKPDSVFKAKQRVTRQLQAHGRPKAQPGGGAEPVDQEQG